MRNAAREAALNIVFAQQFNTDCLDNLKKKVFKQFKLEKEDDVLCDEGSGKEAWRRSDGMV